LYKSFNISISLHTYIKFEFIIYDFQQVDLYIGKIDKISGLKYSRRVELYNKYFDTL